ncbi:MAG TPA: hypothetical protein PKD24_01265 [Pyrinomonadaceae bacterium]|nr:hypothetical protein [Pyrinomonadaceae bacterium]HMP64213.1 hypothetical protein [Pyrinomonadaceae bacterium]
MAQLDENREKAVRYLFGELEAAERDQLEDLIFSDDDTALYLEALEKDLIDEYVNEEMSEALRHRFEQKYLVSEERRERVRMARIVVEKLFKDRPVETATAVQVKRTFLETISDVLRLPVPALAGGLAVLLLVIIGGWFLLSSSQDQSEMVQGNRNSEVPLPTQEPAPDNLPDESKDEPGGEVQMPDTNADPGRTGHGTNDHRPDNRKQEKAGDNTSVPEPRIFVATLLPITRSGERPVLTIPDDMAYVRLSIVHDNLTPYVTYRAELRDSAGEEIYVREVRAQGRVSRPVMLNLPASKLPSGAYEIVLSGVNEVNGVEPIKFYNFSVKRQ